MKRILALIGDFYHSHDNLLKALKQATNAALDSCEIIDASIENFEQFLSQNPDAIVLSAENRINPQDEIVECWMTEKMEKRIKEYVEGGGRLFVWHSGLASYPEEGEFCKLVRGYFKFHPDKQKPVRYHSSHEAAFDGREFDFEIMDEHYFVFCDKDNTNIYLYSESEDGSSIAGWWHNFGKGKVVALTPAHREDGLLDNNFQELLRAVLTFLFK